MHQHVCVCADKSPKGLIYNIYVIYVCSQYVHIYIITWYINMKYYELLCRNYAKPPCPFVNPPDAVERSMPAGFFFHHHHRHREYQPPHFHPDCQTAAYDIYDLWFYIQHLILCIPGYSCKKEARRKWACRALATKLGHISKIWSSSPNCRPVIDTHILC